MGTEASQSIHDIRKVQTDKIVEELKLSGGFFAKYSPKDDVIIIGNRFMVLTLDDRQLDRDDYMDVVKYGYGRLMEALDNNLLNMPVSGHA